MRRLFLALSLVLPVILLVGNAACADELAATIFSYDGTDFVRTHTTLTEDGKSEVGTKLDHDSAAYDQLGPALRPTASSVAGGYIIEKGRERKRHSDLA
jgi:hypothetical protein